MNELLVSVCISVYNKKEFFRKTLESIVNQTHNNIEIIIGDNASEENIKEVVDSFNDPRIQFYRNEVNISTENFINLVKKAKSEYVAIFHADDLYDIHIIEEQIKALTNNPKVAGVFTLGQAIDENGNKSKNHLIRVDKILKGKDMIFDLNKYLKTYIQNSCPFLCPTLMIRKNIYLSIGYNGKLVLINDIDLWTRILEKHELMVINKHLLFYRTYMGQGGAIYTSKKRRFIMPDIPYLYNYVRKNKIKLSFKSWFYLGGKLGKDTLRIIRNIIFSRFMKY